MPARVKPWIAQSLQPRPGAWLARRWHRHRCYGLVSARTQSKRELVAAEMKKRETLYGEFISECSRRAMESFGSSLDKPELFLMTYELLNRIRLCASKSVLQEAERAVTVILDQYFASNLSLEEIRALLRKGAKADPLRSFAEACRTELKDTMASA